MQPLPPPSASIAPSALSRVLLGAWALASMAAAQTTQGTGGDHHTTTHGDGGTGDDDDTREKRYAQGFSLLFWLFMFVIMVSCLRGCLRKRGHPNPSPRLHTVAGTITDAQGIVRTVRVHRHDNRNATVIEMSPAHVANGHPAGAPRDSEVPPLYTTVIANEGSAAPPHTPSARTPGGGDGMDKPPTYESLVVPGYDYTSVVAASAVDSNGDVPRLGGAPIVRATPIATLGEALP